MYRKFCALLIIVLLSFLNSFGQIDKAFEAVLANDPSKLEDAITDSINLNEFNDDDYTCLLISSAYGYLECTQILVENGADVNLGDPLYGSTPIMLAAKYGKLPMCVYLAKHGADMALVDKDKNPLIIYAQLSQFDPLIEYIKDTSLFDLPKAIMYSGLMDRNITEIEAAMDSGCDINVRFFNGFTPLVVASFIGNYSLVQYILEAGADIDLFSSDTMANPLLTAVFANNYEITDLLLSNGADTTLKNNQDISPTLAAYSMSVLGCSNIYNLIKDPQNYVYNPDNEKWECIRKNLYKYYNSGDVFTFKKYLKIAENKLTKEYSISDTSYTNNMFLLVRYYREMESYDDVLRISKNVITSAKKSYGKKSHSYFNLLGSISTNLYLNTDQKELVDLYIGDYVKLMDKYYTLSDTSYTIDAFYIGEMYYNYTEYKKAIGEYKKALKSCELSYGKNEMYNNICSGLKKAYLKLGNIKKAKMYEKMIVD